MRITVKFDSASTEEVRALLSALHSVANTKDCKVHLNGPEAWAGETPPLARDTMLAVLTAFMDNGGLGLELEPRLHDRLSRGQREVLERVAPELGITADEAERTPTPVTRPHVTGG